MVRPLSPTEISSIREWIQILPLLAIMVLIMSCGMLIFVLEGLARANAG